MHTLSHQHRVLVHSTLRSVELLQAQFARAIATQVRLHQAWGCQGDVIAHDPLHMYRHDEYTCIPVFVPVEVHYAGQPRLTYIDQQAPAVFVDKNTKVICQGFTGKNGTFHSQHVWGM